MTALPAGPPRTRPSARVRVDRTRRADLVALRAAMAVAVACATLVATTLSALGRPLPTVLACSGMAAAGPLLLHVLSRLILGSGASQAVPLAAALLTTLGIVTAERLDTGEGTGQAVAALLGVVTFLGGAKLAATQWGHRPAWASPALTALACGLLVLPFVPGLGWSTGGVDLAIEVAGRRVQPGEVARPLFVLVLAVGIAEAQPRLRQAQRRLRALVGLSAPLVAAVFLLVLADDFGPVLMLCVTAVVMVLVARPGAPVVAAVLAVPAAFGVLAAALVPTIRGRITAALEPVSYDGALNHIGFGLRAIARGGWFGTGPGLGDPGAVRYAASDFVMTAIAEERGVLTVLVVLAVYVVMSRSLFFGAERAVDERARLAVVGLTSLIMVQAAYTTLGVLGAVPLTGMAVPFLSLGGSALLGMWLTAGLAVGLGASPSWPTGARFPGITAARRTSTTALVAGAVMAVSVVVSPPVPPGSTVAPDWAQRRGPVLAADGSVLASTNGTGRTYPEGTLFADAVGYTMPGAGSGLEEVAAERLSCAAPWWRRVLGLTCRPPALVTTLVPEVQRAVAARLDGRRGDAVVLDVRTGEVLAAYSTGAPDPAVLTGPAGNGLRRERAADRRVADGPPYAAHATSPGSVYKVVVSAAVARTGTPSATPPATTYLAPGGSRPVHNAGGAVGGGSLDTALTESSNTAFAELAVRVGEDALRSETDTLLGGWDVPAEGPSGVAATVGSGPLDPDALARTGFGQQGVRTTPLALAVLAAEVGSGGLRPTPRLVAGVCTDGFTADEPADRLRVLPEATADRIGAAMEQVVVQQRAPALAGLGVPVAAKTGTAERPDGLYDGLLIAYAPAEALTVAVAVRVEADPATGRSRSGGADAAPVAAAALEAALRSRPDPAHAC